MKFCNELVEVMTIGFEVASNFFFIRFSTITRELCIINFIFLELCKWNINYCVAVSELLFTEKYLHQSSVNDPWRCIRRQVFKEKEEIEFTAIVRIYDKSIFACIKVVEELFNTIIPPKINIT